MCDKARRTLLKQAGLAGAGIASLSALPAFANTPTQATSMNAQTTRLKGNIRHAVSRWTYGHLDIDTLCQRVRELGFSAIDLVGPEDWPTLKQYGIDSSMCNGAELNLVDGWIHPQFHDQLVTRYLDHIEQVAEAGYRNLICFSGNARGMDPATGLENMARGLERILPHAEKHGVTIFMELFNSKIDHPDYMADNSAWGIALCDRLSSSHFSLLYDIYHMQINEGDIIRTIQQNSAYFGHFHTAGVPGRHEIDDSQELNYAAIARAIAETGFTGYLAQEFIPTPETDAGKLASLEQAIRICDV